MNLETLGVQEMNAKEIRTIDGGHETYPGGCNYSGGGMQWEGPFQYGPQEDTGFAEGYYWSQFSNGSSY